MSIQFKPQFDRYPGPIDTESPPYWADSMYLVNRSRRLIALNNIMQSLGNELSRSEIDQTIRRFYINFVKSTCEFLLLPSMSDEEIIQRVHLTGLEHINQGQAEGRGVIMVTAHFGNWELMGARLVREGIPACVIARAPHNRFVAALMERLREASGLRVIMKQNAMREALRSLKRNEVLGILPDQHAGPMGIMINFFGRPASTWQSVALLAMRTGAPIIPVFTIRQPDNIHRVEILEPIPRSQTGDADVDAVETTKRVTQVLETYIRRYPDHWFWVHKRWKGER